jgi:hypothetical protein
VIPLKYDFVRYFSDGLAAIRIGDWGNGKWGFVDENGIEVVPVKYDDVVDFSDGLAKVRIGDYKTGKWGFVDKTGREVVPIEYDDANYFFKGLCLVKLNKKWFRVDKKNKVIPLKYSLVVFF